MMMYLRKFVPVCALLLSWCPCGCDPWLDGDFFFLSHKDADLPIWVKGDLSSDTFIVFLHGGPGASAIDKIYAPGFEPLLDRYAMVFFDQRNSGTSQGNSSAEHINLAQLVEDTTLVVDLIRQKYDPPHLFLMGHSWGGALGTAYLLEGDNEPKIDGWIDVAGVHDYWRRYAVLRDTVLAHAALQIANGSDVGYWEEATAWLTEHPDLATSDDRDRDSSRLRGYVEHIRRNPYWYDQDRSFWPPLGIIGASPLSGMADLKNMQFMAEHYGFRNEIHLADEMGRLTLPSLILFGSHDYVCPPPLGLDAVESLGTPDADKSLVVIDRCGHFSMYERGEAFGEEVVEFIERYR